MELDKIIRPFIWYPKKAEIKWKSLQDKKERGGFGLSNWELYYQAAVAVWIKE